MGERREDRTIWTSIDTTFLLQHKINVAETFMQRYNLQSIDVLYLDAHQMRRDGRKDNLEQQSRDASRTQ